MEFLSKEFNTKTGSYPVHLVVQDVESRDERKPGSYIKADLPFNPTKDFHEYRFDFVGDKVYFYADGKQLGKIEKVGLHTPSAHLVLQHWSNGNDNWSGGPPVKDTSIMVRYVKAYYNTTEPMNNDAYKTCVAGVGDGSKQCRIPEIGINKSAESFYFSNANNTTFSNDTNASSREGTQAPVDGGTNDRGSAVHWNAQAGLALAVALVTGVAVVAL
jgi:hypothetical protein